MRPGHGREWRRARTRRRRARSRPRTERPPRTPRQAVDDVADTRDDEQDPEGPGDVARPVRQVADQDEGFRRGRARLSGSIEGVHPEQRLGGEFFLGGGGGVLLGAQQVGNAGQRADGCHEEHCVGDAESGSQRGNARADWFEEATQRQRHHDVQGGYDVQAHDAEAEQFCGRHDVGGGLGGLTAESHAAPGWGSGLSVDSVATHRSPCQRSGARRGWR
jgi:hypothetical protein